MSHFVTAKRIVVRCGVIAVATLERFLAGVGPHVRAQGTSAGCGMTTETTNEGARFVVYSIHVDSLCARVAERPPANVTLKLLNHRWFNYVFSLHKKMTEKKI